MENELEKVLKSKFFSSAGFAQEIETLVQVNKDMNYIDAIIHFCDQNSIDLESVPKLIPKPLKEKIKYEASELNFLKRSSRAKLPLSMTLTTILSGVNLHLQIFGRIWINLISYMRNWSGVIEIT